jgi:DNA polymerase (family X)
VSPKPRSEPTRRELAGMLWRLADLTQAAERRRSFRAKAYRGAIWSLDCLAADLDETDDRLLATPGIGPGVARLIREYRRSGGIDQLGLLEESYPRDVSILRRLPRMTPKQLRELKQSFGVNTVGDLRTLIDAGLATEVPGVGPATVELWEEIIDLPPNPGLVPSHRAFVTATALAAHFERNLGTRVEVAGEVRRVTEWVSRIDLLVVVDGDVGDFLGSSAIFSDVSLASSGAHHARTHSDIEVAVHVAPPVAAGTALLWATGPEEHAASITAELFATEGDAYHAAGLKLIPPPARELAVDEALGVVTMEDIRGDLHLHSVASPDGRMSLEDIAARAEARGYAYVLITDHTRGLRFGGLEPESLLAQSEEIERLRSQFPGVRIWSGAELNIAPDGTLDIDDSTLDVLDFAVAGVHSNFRLTSDEQTKRVITAMSHPKVRVLAHPFGRRIGIRPPLDVDMARVIEGSVEHSVALETNGHRDRLDLPADWLRTALGMGAFFAANSDAHRVAEMDNISNAVATLQRAGVGPDRVVNTFDADAFERWVRSG